MNADGHELLLLAYGWILVVVCLVGLIRSVLGRGYDLAVYYCSVLGQLEVDLVSINIDGLDGELIALTQLQWCA